MIKLYDVDQAAKLLDLSPLTIRKWLRSGKLKGSKKGKEWRISNEELKRLYPKEMFFLDIDNAFPKMENNRKLAQELYPDEYKQAYWHELEAKPWESFGEKIEEEVSQIYPYPFAPDQIAYWNQDRTDYLEGGDLEARQVYYFLKLKDEQKNFDALLSKLQKEYGLPDAEIDDIKKMSKGVHLLLCVQPRYEG